MRLCEHPLSSYAQKIKIALREKGVTFTAEVPDSFGTGRSDTPFAAANPRTEVPVLIDGDVTIFESTVILEYIEERWPEPPLLPRDPAARAFARLTEDVCDTQYEAVNWGFGEVLWFRRATGALADQLRARAAGQTRTLQAWLEQRLGAAVWFGGDDFGWADAAAAPMVNRSVHYGLGPEPGTPLARWHARIRERPSVAATFAEFDVAAAEMAAASDLYTSGGRRREYRDHRLEWMVKSGGIEVVLAGLRDGNIRFPWPEG
ncbi:Glutathione S-transferase domain [Methylorubrum populi BJ001]|jgi:RNA polymerase-associated protein|uniref:Glutathione S-transferase domain n=1 Tax=Methylorubrum populi (strain ATCC BAA-705 / NCIMB 13946 / BJ001) TaxID=441620 RepID=B1ZEG4_METPB|nr:glutathione S-transferase family protein [Methylorubrum populi]ACB81028.1 Glutathione S-transferase domain [Methylorubrum populi BJ001]OAH33659.1 glutathione S-transferase [Methylorubrum populi]PZP73159.1 MAG: glutathione S-transferase family protein [Methylorubrum populi]